MHGPLPEPKLAVLDPTTRLLQRRRPVQQRLIPPKLAAGRQSDYYFLLEGTEDGYIVIAAPESPG
ncbi:MAG: hypothetical protein HYX27_28415 [Acidobacteria bacterium]|nr:hypothetical protein [Acidobacteriota bacterium]